MRRLTPLAVAVTTTVATATATLGILAPTASTATAATTHSQASAHPQVSAAWDRAPHLPPYVFAPYFETYDTTDGGLAHLSAKSGAQYLSLGFLQTDKPGSCTAYWNGDRSTPISATGRGSFGADISAIQWAGGTVIPSFGGHDADTTDTDLADSCTSVDAIAEVFKRLVLTYHVTRIDLDVEGDSLTNAAGIERRNDAIARTERWADCHHRTVQFDYTLPALPTGLTASGLAVLKDAVTVHARITEVNIMTFDYHLCTCQDMLADTEQAAAATEDQLWALYRHKSDWALWHMIGVTVMPGIDDYGTPETFTTADARALLRWADDEGVGLLSMWALQRDNGDCPGTKGAGNCSGVTQPDWYFSHTFERFTSWP